MRRRDPKNTPKVNMTKLWMRLKLFSKLTTLFTMRVLVKRLRVLSQSAIVKIHQNLWIVQLKFKLFLNAYSWNTIICLRQEHKHCSSHFCRLFLTVFFLFFLFAVNWSIVNLYFAANNFKLFSWFLDPYICLFFHVTLESNTLWTDSCLPLVSGSLLPIPNKGPMN